MNKEIQALDLAIAKLQEEKAKVIKNSEIKRKENIEQSIQKITPKDKILIEKLKRLAKWWRTDGPTIEKTIKVTIKANLLWTEDKEPRVNSYDILYNGKSLNFDDLIRSDLFDRDLEKYQKQINKICNDVDELEKRYPNAQINGMIF